MKYKRRRHTNILFSFLFFFLFSLEGYVLPVWIPRRFWNRSWSYLVLLLFFSFLSFYYASNALLAIYFCSCCYVFYLFICLLQQNDKTTNRSHRTRDISVKSSTLRVSAHASIYISLLLFSLSFYLLLLIIHSSISFTLQNTFRLGELYTDLSDMKIKIFEPQPNASGHQVKKINELYPPLHLSLLSPSLLPLTFSPYLFFFFLFLVLFLIGWKTKQEHLLFHQIYQDVWSERRGAREDRSRSIGSLLHGKILFGKTVSNKNKRGGGEKKRKQDHVFIYSPRYSRLMSDQPEILVKTLKQSLAQYEWVVSYADTHPEASILLPHLVLSLSFFFSPSSLSVSFFSSSPCLSFFLRRERGHASVTLSRC